MNTEFTINVKVSLDATPRLAELLKRLVGQVHDLPAPTPQQGNAKSTTSSEEEKAEEKTEVAEEKTEAAAPANPQTQKPLTEEDVREAMHRVRQRIEGYDYKDHPDSELYKKYHKPLTSYFKGMAITLGFDKPSAINTQEGRASFIRDCAATEILEDGNIGIKPPF